MAFEGNINGKLADMRGIAGAGHAQIQTLSGNLTLTNDNGVIQNLDPGGASRDVTLPAESTANHDYQVYNAADAAEDLVFKNDAGTTIITVRRGQYALIFSDGTNWHGPIIGAGSEPSGMITMYGGTAAPTGWLLCDGTSYLRADYAALFAVIGTAYGSADGSHFNVPDLRGRFPIGLGTNAAVNALGKADAVAEASRTPTHTHLQNVASTTDSGAATGGVRLATGSTGNNETLQVWAGGTGYAVQAKSGVQANAGTYEVVNFIIKI